MAELAVHEALAQLDGDPSFGVFMDEIRRRREAARDAFETASDPWHAGRLQGESALATELLDLAGKARSLIEKKRAR